MVDRLARIQSLVDESPEDALSRYMLAMELKKLGKLEDAVTQFGELVKRNPGYTATYYHYGLLLSSLGKKDAALSVIQSGLEATKKSGEQHAHDELNDALEQVKAS